VFHDETTCCRVFALQGEKAECGGDCGRRSGVCVACLGVTGFDMDGGSVCPSLSAGKWVQRARIRGRARLCV
jgi:hypothetical protein